MSSGPRVTLTGRVGLARRVRWHARLGEALVLGVAAAFVLLYLALRSGSQGLEWHAMAPAGIGGVLIAILWLLETRQSEFDWACNVDRRLGLNGRLLAALSAERGKQTSPMAEMLIEGLRPRVSRQAILRRAVPVSLWLLVLPFVGGALLLQGLQTQRGQVVRWARSAPQFQDLQDQLGEAQQRAQALVGDEVLLQELQVMLDAARRGAIEMKLGKGDAEEWSGELKELAEELARVSQGLRGDPTWDRAMDRAQALVTSLQGRAGEIPPTSTADGAGNTPTPPNHPPAATPGNPSGGPGEVASGGSTAQGAQGGGDSAPAGGGAAVSASEGPTIEAPIIAPDWNSQESRLLAIPQVPRPYRSLVQRFLAPNARTKP